MADTGTNAELERNKAVALRFKKSQGTKDMPQVETEVLAPGYNRIRGGNFHLAGNARDQGWPEPGMYLRTAFPDRVDIIEHIVAEGDTVGLLFRLTATHRGNLFGIAPTGKKVDVYELALLRIVDGQMVEGWFMMDEAELLRQLGARMPVRKDGRIIAPPVPDVGESGDALVQRLSSKMPLSQQDRYKLIAARSRSSAASAGDRTPDYRRQREAFQHLHDYGVARGGGGETLRSALSDRQDRIDRLVTEGDQAWMRFYVHGAHTANLYGIPATGKRVGVPAVEIARFAGGKLRESWCFGDELGLLLQLGVPNLLPEQESK
jgi:predicted ester cyclase